MCCLEYILYSSMLKMYTIAVAGNLSFILQ